jgi:hypothetical protein
MILYVHTQLVNVTTFVVRGRVLACCIIQTKIDFDGSWLFSWYVSGFS